MISPSHQVLCAKEDPDLFVTAGRRLRGSISESVVVGDSVWDLLAARRASALRVGLLSGGYWFIKIPLTYCDTWTKWESVSWSEEPLQLIPHMTLK